ncbi:MAG TPA: hypothetical protein VGC27_12545 [Rhizomicrobium sp.]
MAIALDKGKSSEAEREKLVEEIQELIRQKHLDVNLTVGRPVSATLKGCAQCTICPCMICW